eukprot:631579-Rhodomonas_salina.2
MGERGRWRREGLYPPSRTTYLCRSSSACRSWRSVPHCCVSAPDMGHQADMEQHEQTWDSNLHGTARAEAGHTWRSCSSSSMRVDAACRSIVVCNPTRSHPPATAAHTNSNRVRAFPTHRCPNTTQGRIKHQQQGQDLRGVGLVASLLGRAVGDGVRVLAEPHAGVALLQGVGDEGVEL